MSSVSLPKTDTNPAEPKKGGSKRRKRLRLWIIVTIACLLVLGGGIIAYLEVNAQVAPLKLPTVPANLQMSQIGLANWQEYQQPLPVRPLANPLLPAIPQATPTLALLEDSAGQALIQQKNLTLGLKYLQAAALANPTDMRYGNDYRLALRDHGLYQDEQTFFEMLSKKVPAFSTQIELALSYVDMMRACPKPPDGLVCQAQDSYSSITILDGVLQANPYNIIARYVRGLNHIYWPSLMGHLPKAQQDLQYAVALCRFQQTIGVAFVPLAYVALGDVFAKAGDISAARNVWSNGLRAATPQEQALLQQRLALPQDRLNDLENQQLRGLGVYVDTDLSFFWRKG